MLPAHLLQGHIAYGAAAGGAGSRCIGEGGQAEIGHLGLAVLVDDDVVGLYIQVQHPGLMRHREGPGHRIEDAGDHIEGEEILVVGQKIGQGDALDVFHDEIGRAAAHLEIVYGHDTRVR